MKTNTLAFFNLLPDFLPSRVLQFLSLHVEIKQQACLHRLSLKVSSDFPVASLFVHPPVARSARHTPRHSKRSSD